MKAFFQKRSVVALFSFILGAVTLYFVKPHFVPDSTHPATTSARKALPPLFDEFYNDDFFDHSHDPFKSLQKMREHMKKQFSDPSEGSDIFDFWYQNKFGGGSIDEISKKEDDNFVYYQIRSQGLNKENLNVEIADGLIRISGKVEKKQEEGGSKSYSSSTFNRSFPLPPNIDAQKVEMLQEGDVIVLKFPKYR